MFPCAREIIELETEPGQGNRSDLFAAAGSKFRQDPPVIAKDTVDVSNERAVAPMLPVVPGRATLIITKLFIGTACYVFPTLNASTIGFEMYHRSFVLRVT
jgi:hypothetical protein